MAKKKKHKNKSKKEKTKKRSNRWDDLLDSMESNTSGDAFFLKEGKTRMKLIPEDEDDEESFFVDVTRTFQGKEKTKKLVRAWVMGQDEDRIRGVVFPITAFKSVLQMLSEGYELLTPDGYGITVVATGQKLERAYSVMPSRKEVDLPDDLQDLEKSLDDLAEEIYNADKDREKEYLDGKKGKKNKRKKDEDEDEDEDENW